MAFVAFAGQALGGGAVDAVAPGRLQQMEQVETQRLFGGGIAVDEQFRAVPELRQRRGLTRGDHIEAVRHRLMQGLRGVRGQVGRVRVGVGGVDDELLDRRRLSGLQLREIALGDMLLADFGLAEAHAFAQTVRLAADHAHAAAAGRLDHVRAAPIGLAREQLQTFGRGHTDARVVALFGGRVAAFDRRGQGDGAGVVDRRDGVADREQIHAGRAAVERQHALGADFDAVALRGLQAHTPPQQTAAQIEFAFEREPLRRVDVQALRAQPHRDALPVGDRQAGVGAAGETREALVVVDRVLFEHRRQKAAVAAAVGLLEAAAHAE